MASLGAVETTAGETTAVETTAVETTTVETTTVGTTAVETTWAGDDDVAVGEIDTPVGRLAVAVSQVGLAGVGWRDPEHLVAGRRTVADRARLAPALDQLEAYFAGELREFDLPLDLRGVGTSRRLVLTTLFNDVRYGESITYGELAHRSHSAVPARGIGAIMGSNPIPIVVPCHRVVAANGLGGYSGGRSGDGLATKRWLLTLEGVLQPTLDWPV